MLGISTDNPRDNEAFKRQNSFPFPLLCDTGGKIAYAYGAAGFENAFMARRISYLIDEKGIVAKSFSKVIPADHADELLQLLS